jgi:hypothetical protein
LLAHSFFLDKSSQASLSTAPVDDESMEQQHHDHRIISWAADPIWIACISSVGAIGSAQQTDEPNRKRNGSTLSV